MQGGRLGGESQQGVSERDIPGARRRRGKSGKAGESCSLRPGHLARGPPAGGTERTKRVSTGTERDGEYVVPAGAAEMERRKRGGSPGGERA